VIELGDLSGQLEGITLLAQLARAYFLNDDSPRAIEIADQVLQAAEHADMKAVVADTLVTKGTALGAIGRVIEGVGIISAGRQLAEANGFSGSVLRAINNLGFIEALSGLALASRLGIRGWVASMLQNVGEFGLRTGAWTESLSMLEPALSEDWDDVDRMWILVAVVPIRAIRGAPVADAIAEIVQLSGNREDTQATANIAMAAGLVAFASGNFAEARSAFHEAGSFSSPLLAVTRPRAARAALWSGDPAGAQEDLAAIEASGIHGPSVEAERRTIRAGLAALEGRSIEAMAHYREALRMWRDLGLAWDEALCGLDMALLLSGESSDVRPVAEATREILVRLGAAPFIARLDAALESARDGGPSAAQAGSTIGRTSPIQRSSVSSS
jgi:tetratricopeptide (TPR) repeat protein